MDSDFGIKASLPGKDVNDAGDSDLLSSSSWPTLKMYTSVFRPTTNSTEIGANGLPILYKHNLGFVPAIIPFGNAVGNGQGNNATQLYADLNRQNLAIDKYNVYYIPPGGPAGTPDMGLSIFYLDIEKSFEAKNINTGTSSNIAIDNNYGIKMTKENADIDSNDLRDFIIHSSTRSPLVHAVVPGIATGDSIFKSFSYTHTLPYDPIFFAYTEVVYSGSLIENCYTLINGYGGLGTSNKTITITVGTQSRTSFVILKDPFSIDDNVITVTG